MRCTMKSDEDERGMLCSDVRGADGWPSGVWGLGWLEHRHRAEFWCGKVQGPSFRGEMSGRKVGMGFMFGVMG